MKHETALEYVNDFLTDTDIARRLSERDRDYYDGYQWTDEEIAKLTARNQAPIVVNRIRPKVEGLKGLLVQRKTDPKAYPRTQKDEEGAEAVTDGLRYVADNTTFDDTKLDVADNIFVEGYGAAIVEFDERGEVAINHIPWDRYFYDTHSRKKDFSDVRWDGMMVWMDIEQAKEVFNLSEEEENNLFQGLPQENNGWETFDDRPRWVNHKKRRIRIAQMFFIDEGGWKMCFFSEAGWLIEPMDSPYLDEYGDPTDPIVKQCANIDRDNNRYGEVRNWIDLQDEINHRRSKFLHLNNVRQTAARKGAIADVPSMKRELSKPDGHVEYIGEKGDFEVLGTGDMKEAQFQLYLDGKSELDAVGFNAQLSGERQGDLSGRAISNLQQAAVNELASLYNGLSGWENRVYRQVWMRMKQSWTKNKWIRILDDQSKIRWVGFNQEMTRQEQLEEMINDQASDLMIRKRAAAVYTKMLQNQDPQLQQIVEVKNNIVDLDVDILIETSLDSINVQQEQFYELAKIAQTRPDVPFEEVVKMSTLRSEIKDRIIKSLEASRQAAGQSQQQQAQIDAQKTLAQAEDAHASATKKNMEAIQTQIQNKLLTEKPPENTGVVL